MMEKTTCDCLRCSHRWESKTPTPSECPNCHSCFWDQPRKIGPYKDTTGRIAKYQMKGGLSNA